MIIAIVFAWLMSGLNAYFIAAHARKVLDGDYGRTNWLEVIMCILSGPVSLFFSLVILMEVYEENSRK